MMSLLAIASGQMMIYRKRIAKSYCTSADNEGLQKKLWTFSQQSFALMSSGPLLFDVSSWSTDY
ncbi:hypothetical protein AUC60_21320 [Pseudomonas caspiana]|uniref:Uncharacterized protein n=1 Tax=Pseudomonas caspiana TaxID=1451454 RepID=A0A1Y3NWE4_9PSED|nr:hypothetical protein AUC60_21320 [Pseudomonas caspiana]